LGIRVFSLAYRKGGKYAALGNREFTYFLFSLTLALSRREREYTTSLIGEKTGNFRWSDY